MKFSIITILLASLITSLCSQEISTHKNVRPSELKTFQKAVQLYQSNQFTKAKLLFEKLTSQNPKFIDAHLQLASVCFEMENFICAQTHFYKVLELDSNYNHKIYYTLALCQYQLDLFYVGKQNMARFLQLETTNTDLILKAKALLPKLHFADSASKHPLKLLPLAINNLNTPFSEYLPSLTADSKTLVFTRRNKSNNEDLFISHYENNSWTEAQPIHDLNSPFNEGSPAIAPDGLSLVFTSCDRPNSYGGCDLYFSQFIDGQWSTPVNMGEKINTPAYESQACLSHNGLSIYFTSNRKGTLGGLDIWQSKRKADYSWTFAKNLGPVINTPGNEDCPFVHPNASVLYFSSDFYPGMGGKDLFYSKISDKGHWQIPINLGYPINSKGDESSFVVYPNGKNACYASDQNNFNNSDKNLRYNLDLFEIDLPDSLQINPSTYVEIFIQDFITNKSVAASISIFDLSNNKIYFKKENETSGYLLVALPSGADYALHINNPNYIFEPDQFRCSQINTLYQPLRIYKKLKKPTAAASQSITLKNIFFEFGSAKLKPESFFELNELVNFLNYHKEIKLKITGHTDHIGSIEDNLVLSERRAQAVIEYLYQNGIALVRLVAEGKGETEAIASNESEIGRFQNRRIEFLIIQP